MNNYSIYWIHLPQHDDIEKQGYVGISNNPERRFKEHLGNLNTVLSNAIRKYGAENLIFEVITEGITFEEAKQFEKDLRPKMRIGWNIMTGGSVPPSNKGSKRLLHSERMKGKNNPFYGKTHSKETRKILSEKKTGSKNYFYGKKRPDHSEKLKQKKGKDYPKFRGYFITPIGKFDSYKIASEKTGLKITSLYNYCHSSDRTITNLSYSKSSFLKTLGTVDEIVGKTYGEIGFGFEHV